MPRRKRSLSERVGSEVGELTMHIGCARMTIARLERPQAKLSRLAIEAAVIEIYLEDAKKLPLGAARDRMLSVFNGGLALLETTFQGHLKAMTQRAKEEGGK